MFDLLMTAVETDEMCIGAGEMFEIISCIIKGLSPPLRREYHDIVPHILVECLRVLYIYIYILFIIYTFVYSYTIIFIICILLTFLIYYI